MIEQNPWWTTSEVPSELLPEKARFAYKDLSVALGGRNAEFITGPRYGGKTTLMHQLVNHLLKKGVDPKHVFYYSFDEKQDGFGMLMIDYEKAILKRKLADEKVYMFLDEVHKLHGWESKLKLLNESNPKLKLFVSSSMAIDRMMTPEKGQPWYNVHRVPPLTFLEFLHIRGERIPRVEGVMDAETFEGMLKINLKNYMNRGFPEIVNADDRFAKKYVKEMVLGRIIFRDVWEAFNVKDMGLVRNVAEILLSSPGYTVNVNSIASELDKARKTVRNVLDHLERSFVVRILNNLRGQKLVSSRKNQKAYPAHCSLAETDDEEMLAGTLVCNEIDALGYWGAGAAEVDFLARVDGRAIPVKVHMKEKITDADLRGIKNFCRRFRLERGIVVTEDVRGRMNWADLVPLHSFLTYPSKYLAPTTTLGI